MSLSQLKKRLNPKPKRQLRPCGTNAAYKRHARAGEYCPPCWAAHSKEVQQWKYKNAAASAGLQCLSCADEGQVSAQNTASSRKREKAPVSTISRPSRLEVLMMQAEVQALRGTCSRLSVGVVIHRDGRILSTGYNGAPAGVNHCDHTCDCGMPLKYGNDVAHAVDCNSFRPCIIAAHAERNAIDWAARYGLALDGSELVVTDTPCAQCAGSIINAGIRSVVAKRPYRDQTGVRMLEQAGVSMSLASEVI